MKKVKSSIKDILSNWYILKAVAIIETIDVLLPIQLAINTLVIRGELNSENLAILKAYQQGYNYEEIAKLFKLSRQTVSSRITNIILRIETLIGDGYDY